MTWLIQKGILNDNNFYWAHTVVSSSVLDFIWVYAIHCWWLKKSQWNAHRPPRKTKNNPSQRIPNVNEITIDLVWDQFKPSYTIIISTITQVIYYIWGREAEISLAQIRDMVFNVEYLNQLCSQNMNYNSISWSKKTINKCF